MMWKVGSFPVSGKTWVLFLAVGWQGHLRPGSCKESSLASSSPATSWSPPFHSSHQEHIKNNASWMLWGWDKKPSFFLPSLTVVPCFAQKPICCWRSVCSTVLCSPPPQAVAVGFSSSHPKSHLLSAANKLQLWMTPKENRRHAASDLADGSICFVTFISFC